ncbi:UNVERIFIED_CONTAM: hypothetical protein FKN15_046741 [Acipenser sinensis]
MVPLYYLQHLVRLCCWFSLFKDNAFEKSHQLHCLKCYSDTAAWDNIRDTVTSTRLCSCLHNFVVSIPGTEALPVPASSPESI